MAKKNYRPTAAARKKVADKKLAEKLAKRRAIWQKYQKQIILAAAAAVVAIIVLCLAVDYFYTPNGSMRTFLGKTLGVTETSLVRGIDGLYYELGNMSAPEGYAKAEYSMQLSSDPNETYLYFETADETKVIDNVYVSGVEDRTGADMVQSLAYTGMYEYVGEAGNATIGGYEVNYLYTQSKVSDEEDSLYVATLIGYVDSIKDCCVLISSSSAHAPQAELPAEEAMLAEMEGIVAALKVPQ